jgi:hypothetical protein
MPLPPLPPNSTFRLFIDYTSYARAHTLMLRFPGTPTPADAVIISAGLRTAMRGMMLVSDYITGIRFSNKNGLVTMPAIFTAQPGLVTTPNTDSDPESFFFSVVGRDTIQGRTVRYSMYGVRNGYARSGDNRYAEGEQVATDAFLDELTALTIVGEADPPLVSVAELPVVLNRYVNCANSAYWQRKQRG